MSNLITVNDNNFDVEVLQADKLVLIKWTATFCGPCQRQKPIVEKFAEEHPNIKVCEAETDDCPNMCSSFGIKSIPTLMLFNNGKHVGTKVGSSSYTEIEAFIAFNIKAEIKEDGIS